MWATGKGAGTALERLEAHRVQRTSANPGVFRAHVWKTTFSLLLDGVCFKVGAVIKFLGIYCLKGHLHFSGYGLSCFAIGFSVYAFMIPRAFCT